MVMATYAVPHFLGGEISKFAQGRFDRPDYKVSLNVCLNAFPIEIGAWTRRPGTAHAGPTRGGAPARTIKFDVMQAAPHTLEFSAGVLRFRNGKTLLTTNDAASVVAVSSANPAVVNVSAAVTWATGDTVILPGASTPLLENRQFVITVSDSTHFSIADALTGAAIDGSTLGALAAGTTVERVLELVTSYVGTTWSTIRAVQAETTDILLCGTVAPQALIATLVPNADPTFTINPVVFQDGPYLDPFTNGVQATPGSVSGTVTITLAFAAYSASVVYSKGDFVTDTVDSNNYVSLIDSNVGNTPHTTPAAWAATSANAAINNGLGFLGTDIGRQVRLFSEPLDWAVGTTYAAGTVVRYNPTGLPNAATYWSSITSSNLGHVPGTDIVNWTLIPQGAAIWTWGRIASLSNVIAGATGTAIGDMTGGGGVAAAFNGQPAQVAGLGAEESISGGTTPWGTIISFSSFVGKNYSGVGGKKIEHVTVYPSPDKGLGTGDYQWTTPSGSSGVPAVPSFTLNLRGKATAPASPSDGTLLGTTGSFFNQVLPLTVISNDQTTTWNFVWVELLVSFPIITSDSSIPASAYHFSDFISQVIFFLPPGTGTTAGINVNILGPALLYTNPIKTWRLGAFSDTTGWPTCGCYHDSRLWLGGAIDNRVDASVSNGILAGSSQINFAPTDQYGTVSDANAISETLNADSVNPLFWLEPDLQGILVGTQAGEFLLSAPTAGAMSPLNISSRRTTKIGSENIEPRRTEHTLIFVKRYGRKLMEYFADVFSGKFTAPNVADRAQHITQAGVAELAYTEAVTPVLWGRDTVGALFGVTYKRDALTTSQGPTYAAFHRHALGTGRTVESICAGPSVGGDLDSLTMVTNDPTTSFRHVEVMTDTPDEDTALTSSWFLDDAVNPTSVSSSLTPIVGAPNGGLTINGLWHLNGKTVTVFAGGLDCGDLGDLLPTWLATTTYPSGAQVTGSNGFWYTSQAGSNTGNDPTIDDGTHWLAGGTDYAVSNGSIFVPYGDSISAGPGGGLFTAAFATALPLTEIVVGCTYNSDGQLVRRIEPAETGARTGLALGLKRRIHRFAMLLVNTRGVFAGNDFDNLRPALLRKKDDITPIGPLEMYGGTFQDTFHGDYDYDGMLAWRVSRPFPATVSAIAGNNEAQDQ